MSKSWVVTIIRVWAKGKRDRRGYQVRILEMIYLALTAFHMRGAFFFLGVATSVPSREATQSFFLYILFIYILLIFLTLFIRALHLAWLICTDVSTRKVKNEKHCVLLLNIAYTPFFPQPYILVLI